MAFCSSCGKELTEGASFCSQCGAAQQPTGTATAPQQPARRSRRVNRRRQRAGYRWGLDGPVTSDTSLLTARKSAPLVAMWPLTAALCVVDKKPDVFGLRYGIPADAASSGVVLAPKVPPEIDNQSPNRWCRVPSGYSGGFLHCCRRQQQTGTSDSVG